MRSGEESRRRPVGGATDDTRPDLHFVRDPLSTHAREIYAMFEDPEFHFAVSHPELLSEEEIRELVDADTYGVLRGSEPIGLYSNALWGSAKEGNHDLTIRLRSDVPLETCVAVHHEVIRRIRLVHDVVRITLWVGGYDHRGLEIARACDGLVEEGSIANEVLHYGNLYEEFAFSLVLTPPEETA